MGANSVQAPATNSPPIPPPFPASRRIRISCLMESGSAGDDLAELAEGVAYCAGVPFAVAFDFLVIVACPGDYEDGFLDDWPSSWPCPGSDD